MGRVSYHWGTKGAIHMTSPAWTGYLFRKRGSHELILLIYIYIYHTCDLLVQWCIPVITQAINALAFQKQQTMLVIMNFLLTFQNNFEKNESKRNNNNSWKETYGIESYTVMYLNIEKLSRLKIHNLHMTETTVIKLKRSTRSERIH